MSCWVVPSVAAEYWRVSVDHVMECIRRGAVSVREENGFTFVDVLPDPGTREVKLPKEERPPTYVAPEMKPEPKVEAAVMVAKQPVEGLISCNPIRMRTGGLRRAPVRG